MQDLIDLVNLVQKTKFKTHGLLECILQPNSQTDLLYQAIVQKQVLNDEDAKVCFPEFSKDPGKLANVKNRLKDRLSDSVFLLGFRENAFADRQKAYLDCLKTWASAMIMINRNARNVGINQLENLLRNTLRYDFTELSTEVLRVLRLHYGLCSGDEKKYAGYCTQLAEMEKVRAVEVQIEGMYMDLVIRFVNVKSGKGNISDRTEELTTVGELLEEYQSFKVQLFGHMIQLAIYDSRNDFVHMEQTCKAALDYFQKKDYQSNLSIEIFYYNLIICYLYTRQYEACFAMMESFGPKLVPGSFNWFKLKELEVYTCLHAQMYQKGYDIYQETTSLTEFEQLAPSMIEIWKIMEAYFYYLAQIDALTGPTAAALKVNFKKGRFLNEVPVMSKDKQGMNVSILIVQLLFHTLDPLCREGDAYVESLNKYRTRYLTQQESLRSNYFLGMLVLALQAGRDLDVVEQKSKKFLNKLQETPWQSINQNHEIEIIPYDRLWLLILNDLKHRRKFKTSPPQVTPGVASVKALHLKVQPDTAGFR
jgi:hypothetical protein